MAASMKPPAWLAQAERRTSPRKFYATTAVITFVIGAMTSTVISRWLFLPGLVLTFGLLWFIAVNAQKSRWIPALFIFATIALVAFALFLMQDKALADRGRWVDLVVVDKSQTRSQSYCRVRDDDGQVIDGPTGGCRGTDVGDRIRLFVDPEDEVPPSNTAPNVALWIWLAAGTNTVFTACVVRAAVRGVGRQRELQAMELAASPPRFNPPPPPPPPSSSPPSSRW